MHMNPFPELTTPRLILRKLAISDVPALIKNGNSKSISDNVLNVPSPYTEEDAVAWIAGGWQGFKNGERYAFAIVLREINELIGAIGMHINSADNRAEIGYWLGEDYRDKGIMTEAVKRIIRFGFDEVRLNKIFATCFTDNPSSEKVLQNAGMIKEGELKDQYRVKGVYKSVHQYRVTKQEHGL